MHLRFVFTLLIVTIIIPGTFNITPGDPFPNDLNNNSSLSFLSDLEELSNKTLSSTIKSESIEKNISKNNSFLINTNETLINKTQNDNLLFSSTLKPIQDTLPIYKKHLVPIAQWKYTDPKTHQTRYWYHTADSIMGDGWILDSILCQAYIRQKPDTIPIQVFHSETKNLWTNTLQIETTPLPIGNNQWIYDGTPFYVYKTSINSTLLKPIWRYWNRINYGTEDVSEPRRSYLRMGDIVDDNLSEWRLDRIIFYAFSPDMNVTQLEN